MLPKSLAPLRVPVPGVCGLVDRGVDTAPLVFVHGVAGHNATAQDLSLALRTYEVCIPQLGRGLSLRPLELVPACRPELAPPATAPFGCAAHDPVTGLTYVTLGHALYCIDAGGNLQWVCGDAGTPGGADGEAQAARFAFPSRLSCRDSPGSLAVLDENGLRMVSLIAPGRCSNVQSVLTGAEDCAEAELFMAEDTRTLLSAWPHGHDAQSPSPIPCCPSPSLSLPSPVSSYRHIGNSILSQGLNSITGVAALPPHGYKTATSFSQDQDTTDTGTRARRADLLLTDARQDGFFAVHHVAWLPSVGSGSRAAAAAVQVCTVFDSAQVGAWEVASGAALFAADCRPDGDSKSAPGEYSTASSISAHSGSGGSCSCAHLASGSSSVLRSAQYGWVEVLEVDEDIQSATAAAPPSPPPSSAMPDAFDAAAATATAATATVPAVARAAHGPGGDGAVDPTDAPSMDSGELSYSRLHCYSPCCGDNRHGNFLVSGVGDADVSNGCCGCYGALHGGAQAADSAWRCGGVRCPVALPGGLLLLVCPLEGQLLLLHLPQLAEMLKQPQHQEEEKLAAVAGATGVAASDEATSAACDAAQAAAEAAVPPTQRRISCGSSNNNIGDSNFHVRGGGSDDTGSEEDTDSRKGAADTITAAVAAADVSLECSSSDISGGRHWRCGGGGCGDPGVSSGARTGDSAASAAWARGLLPYNPARRQQKRRRWECLLEAAAAINSDNSGRYKRARLVSKDC